MAGLALTLQDTIAGQLQMMIVQIDHSILEMQGIRHLQGSMQGQYAGGRRIQIEYLYQWRARAAYRRTAAACSCDSSIRGIERSVALEVGVIQYQVAAGHSEGRSAFYNEPGILRRQEAGGQQSVTDQKAGQKRRHAHADAYRYTHMFAIKK
jgi:hypothetical protein